MWKGRFKTDTAQLLKTFSESVSFDWRLFRHDIAGSIAHSKALLAAGLLTAEEQGVIETTLLEIRSDIEQSERPGAAGESNIAAGAGSDAATASPKPSFWKTELEDVHMNIEAELTRRIKAATGKDTGAKLHTARSRNDQVALDLRLYLRDEADEIRRLLAATQRALVELAWRNIDVVIPGYTHLQRAQPVLFAHHLLAYVEMFARDAGRVADARRRINVCPLGSGAIAGSTINLDRALIARELGFVDAEGTPRLTQNSMDAVSDRDFAVELLAALALVGIHLSRLSEDLILWASAEFRFVTISDAYTTGSSLMPQKKNPDVCELTRGKTGRLVGNLASLLTTLKGLPMTYNRDMQEDKEPVFDSVDTVKAALQIYAAMLAEVQVNPPACAEAVNDWALLATDVADYLVLHGVPFRQAHEVVGKLVALCLERKTGLAELPLEDYRALSPAFEADIYDILTVQRSINARTNPGAPSKANIAKQIEQWKKRLPGDTKHPEVWLYANMKGVVNREKKTSKKEYDANSEAELQIALDIKKQTLGESHPYTIATHDALARTLRIQGKYAEAEKVHRAVLETKKKKFGETHYSTLSTHNNLASSLYLQGKYEEAEKEDRIVLKIRKKTFGDEHPSTLSSRTNLINALKSQQKYNEAETECRKAIKAQEKILGNKHPETLQSLESLLEILTAQKKKGEAASLKKRIANCKNA